MTRLTQDIINLTRIATNDGGSQTACSFLQQLSEQRDPRDYQVVAFRDSNAGRLAEELGYDVLLINRNARERIHLDLTCRKRFRKGQLCFTFHGVPWLTAKSYLINLCGTADSNLYYPEIPFWSHCSPSTQALKFAKDRGRMFGYSRSDYWVFETDTLARRAIEMGNYPRERVAVVKMSPSSFVSRSRVDARTRDRFQKQLGDSFSLLFMAGANPNKRIGLIGPAIAELRARRASETPIKVVTTLDPQSDYYQTLRQEFARMHVSDAWLNLGPVPYDEIPSLIDACSVVCLFSVLESFSSNITESWAMSKPLLITDADWARSACGRAARYVSPANAGEVADAILQLMRPEKREALVATYDEQSRSYPTARERCQQYLECMETARRMGSMSSSLRKSVRRFACRKHHRSVGNEPAVSLVARSLLPKRETP